MKVFSSNARPLEEGEVYDKFAVYTHLYHCGDFEAAARVLAGRGFGRVSLLTSEQEVNDFYKDYYNEHGF